MNDAGMYTSQMKYPSGLIIVSTKGLVGSFERSKPSASESDKWNLTSELISTFSDKFLNYSNLLVLPNGVFIVLCQWLKNIELVIRYCCFLQAVSYKLYLISICIFLSHNSSAIFCCNVNNFYTPLLEVFLVL